MKIKTVLISQPAPAENEKSPFSDLAKKYNLKPTFRKLFKIEGVHVRDVRQERVDFDEYNGVIMTSRNAVDHFFRVAKEMRVDVSPETKYFCNSETTAFYLQNYVQYRKRKIFFCNSQSANDFFTLINKHKNDHFLLPCSDNCKQDLPALLKKNKIKHTPITLFRTVPDDVTDLEIAKYDLIAVFSPIGIQSLKQNFPAFKQGKTVLATFGSATSAAAEDAGFKVQIKAPTPTAPSMAAAIEEYLQVENGKTVKPTKATVKTKK